jgi:hypothetical protein
VPTGADAVILLTVEELAVNDLRETFHHWVRTLAFPVRNGVLGEPLSHAATRGLRPSAPAQNGRMRAREIVDDVEPRLRQFLVRHGEQVTDALTRYLEEAGRKAREDEDQKYRSRRGEVSSLIAENTIGRLEREILRLKEERRQGLLFDEQARLDEIERSIEERHEEIARRTRHYEEVRRQLEQERDRVLKNLLPKRYSMNGSAHVFPITIEVRLPE